MVQHSKGIQLEQTGKKPMYVSISIVLSTRQINFKNEQLLAKT